MGPAAGSGPTDLCKQVVHTNFFPIATEQSWQPLDIVPEWRWASIILLSLRHRGARGPEMQNVDHMQPSLELSLKERAEYVNSTAHKPFTSSSIGGNMMKPLSLHDCDHMASPANTSRATGTCCNHEGGASGILCHVHSLTGRLKSV